MKTSSGRVIGVHSGLMHTDPVPAPESGLCSNTQLRLHTLCWGPYRCKQCAALLCSRCVSPVPANWTCTGTPVGPILIYQLNFYMNTAMPLSNATATKECGRQRAVSDTDTHHPGGPASAVSWSAILAGAAAAAALSLILLILGTGLGFSAVSPWSQKGISAGGFGVSTILWVTLTQLFASGLGGYLAGRLRTRWLSVHEDEVYFRDTAHGFLAWAIASLATAALLTSVISSIVGSGAQASASAVGGAATAGASSVNSELARPDADGTRTGYFIDSLFRTAPRPVPSTSAPKSSGELANAAQQNSAQPLAEVTRIFMNSLRTGPLPIEDLRYSAQVVAHRTGLSQPDAEKRVTDTYDRMQARFNAAQTAARETADKARKASAHAALWLFVSLCQRRLNIDPPCRSNIDPGRVANS